MKVLSLNCQRGYQPGLKDFLHKTLESSEYDFLLLQEVDKTVLAFLQHPSYKAVRAFCDEAGEEAELCIVYRTPYELKAHGYQSFAAMRNDPWRGRKHPSFGFLWAEFLADGNFLRVGSIHLHSGIDRKARMAELTKAKEILLGPPPTPTIFSGDTNAGFPGESKKLAALLAPEFVWATRNLGPTLDSRYSENVPHLPNRIAAFFSLFNIRIPLWTDQMFVDAKTATQSTITCRILPDRVSDHSPVEMIIKTTEPAQ